MFKKCVIAMATLLFLTASSLIEGNRVWADAKSVIMEERMVLEKKEGDCIVINDSCYRFIEITEVKDRLGETISHSALPFPCVAKLRYSYNPKKNAFDIFAIEILDDLSLGGSK